MARRVYFCFHYQDVIDFRVNVVRNHWILKADRDDAGFFDASLWEEAKKQGSVAVKRLINAAIAGTSVTCILIGSRTFARRWVRYEVLKSLKKGNEVFAVHVNSICGKDRLTKPRGPNPLAYMGISFSQSGITATLHHVVDGKWREYDDADGGASFQIDPVRRDLRGKGFNLKHFFPTYDWIEDVGYDNFSSWVG